MAPPGWKTRRELLREREALIDALYRALPYVEDHEGSPIYKPGTVRAAVKAIRDVLKRVQADRVIDHPLGRD
jgi:hypothetical protein